jgi:hypothetical protein
MRAHLGGRLQLLRAAGHVTKLHALQPRAGGARASRRASGRAGRQAAERTNTIRPHCAPHTSTQRVRHARAHSCARRRQRADCNRRRRQVRQQHRLRLAGAECDLGGQLWARGAVRAAQVPRWCAGRVCRCVRARTSVCGSHAYCAADQDPGGSASGSGAGGATAGATGGGASVAADGGGGGSGGGSGGAAAPTGSDSSRSWNTACHGSSTRSHITRPRVPRAERGRHARPLPASRRARALFTLARRAFSDSGTTFGTGCPTIHDIQMRSRAGR